jgi:hypothetical protein
MVATHKYKEIYDMQASKRKATWFNMQKLVVNNYALGMLVLRSQHLLKVFTLIASRSLSMTDFLWFDSRTMGFGTGIRIVLHMEPS